MLPRRIVPGREVAIGAGTESGHPSRVFEAPVHAGFRRHGAQAQGSPVTSRRRPHLPTQPRRNH